jgi:hypothetical protein
LREWRMEQGMMTGWKSFTPKAMLRLSERYPDMFSYWEVKQFKREAGAKGESD